MLYHYYCNVIIVCIIISRIVSFKTNRIKFPARLNIRKMIFYTSLIMYPGKIACILSATFCSPLSHYRLRSRCFDYLIYSSDGSTLARSLVRINESGVNNFGVRQFHLTKKSARFINVGCDTINLFHEIRRDTTSPTFKWTRSYTRSGLKFVSSFSLLFARYIIELLAYRHWIMYCQFA